MSLASLTDFLSANPQLGLVMIVGLGFIEACPGIGLFVSGVILFGVASFLFVEDLFSIVQIVPCAMLGGFLADQFGYWLGRRLGPNLKESTMMRPHASRLDRAEILIRRFGPLAAVGGRFLTMIRSVVPLLLGMAGLSWPRYLLWDLIAVSIWGLGFVLLLGGLSWLLG
ncbi:MAG: hypothetical protein CMQ23_00040 [Gammaproteobacteria bacterium]|jgi:membrane-associated protein|nr:hypothetical protein [Gammaproteobacteria bacterium]|tara:strand:- start:152 stop:658 length:507 start_codon:yes stop_codon:yes gene_type:complete